MTIWKNEEKSLNIKKNELHIWKIKVPYHIFDGNFVNYCEINNKIFDYLMSIITYNEFKSSICFVKTSDQVRSICTKYALRILISKYLKIAPKFIQFYYNEFSKPFINHELNSSLLQFNISHAGDFIVIAFSCDSYVGIDIEKYDYSFDLKSIEGYFFSKNELLKWNSLSSRQKLSSFYYAWSCKEAFLKGVGCGFSYLPNNITVNIDPDEEPSIFELNNCMYENDKSAWFLGKFSLQNNYSAIYAVRQLVNQLKFYEFDLKFILPSVKPRSSERG